MSWSPRAMGAFSGPKLPRILNLSPDARRRSGRWGIGIPLFAAADHPGLFESLAVGGAATRVDLAGRSIEGFSSLQPKGAIRGHRWAQVAVSGYLSQGGRKITAPPVHYR